MAKTAKGKWNGPEDKRHVGRKGKPNKLTTEIKAILLDLVQNLDREALLKWAAKNPGQLILGLIKVLPREFELKGEDGGPVDVRFTFNYSKTEKDPDGS